MDVLSEIWVLKQPPPWPSHVAQFWRSVLLSWERVHIVDQCTFSPALSYYIYPAYFLPNLNTICLYVTIKEILICLVAQLISMAFWMSGGALRRNLGAIGGFGFFMMNMTNYVSIFREPWNSHSYKVVKDTSYIQQGLIMAKKLYLKSW